MLFHPHTCKPWVLLGWNERRNRGKALWPGVSARKTVSDSEKMGWEEVGRWMWLFPHWLPCRRMQKGQEGTGSSAGAASSVTSVGTRADLPYGDTHSGDRGWFTLQGHIYPAGTHTDMCTGLTVPAAKTCSLTSAWTQACFHSSWAQ